MAVKFIVKPNKDNNNDENSKFLHAKLEFIDKKIDTLTRKINAFIYKK